MPNVAASAEFTGVSMGLWADDMSSKEPKHELIDPPTTTDHHDDQYQLTLWPEEEEER